jgi:hypothetical protein
VKKYISTNLDDYFETHDGTLNHKCINCAKCMSPQGGKLIYYKYPNNVGTTNNKVYNLKNKSMKFGDNIHERLSFNYDTLRNVIKKETQE